ncbi:MULTISPECIES: hypothetical protein [Rhodopseudomonas]|uniref:Uncharacterized protein n=1 Tax=Rhodopseudomonas palustris TaxID=1076 RepID=A0A0D7EIN2_RHOPL|nr:MULTISPECIES: hypothetical protein [Rhodopseudomonas]KIZ40511.1 hypothetical protein OO17_17525 [Rhodopseudomonas palustris]MDF3812493.1 hypothetical protein [Rhodopseudomonas sp. BAL398]WOK19491.1 hypothetical protein RBJ75_08240 [Rhodopseudomonas sp. BAL398]
MPLKISGEAFGEDITLDAAVFFNWSAGQERYTASVEGRSKGREWSLRAASPSAMKSNGKKTMGTVTLPGDFEIAPGHRVREWNSLTLNEAESGTAEWNKALAIFDARIRSRFIEPAQILINSENGKGRGTNGFAVLAIDFLLIETIEGFRRGLTSHRTHSKALFKAFLTGWPAFISCVPAGKSADDLAVNVFEQGRCALHHTGSTDRIVVRKSGPVFVFHDDGRIEINRSRLHRELTKAFDSYLADLHAPPSTDLRKKFITKMNHICS